MSYGAGIGATGITTTPSAVPLHGVGDGALTTRAGGAEAQPTTVVARESHAPRRTAERESSRDTGHADDYWARASAKPHLHKVAVPALVLNALNDPFVPATSLPQARDTSSHVTLWQPAQGGHVGFPSQPFPGQVRVMPEAVTAFLAAQLEAPLHNPGAIASASSGAK